MATEIDCPVTGITAVPIGTAEQPGLLQPDGITIVVNDNGGISAPGGTGGGITSAQALALISLF